jgi:hypothetical protein
MAGRILPPTSSGELSQEEREIIKSLSILCKVREISSLTHKFSHQDLKNQDSNFDPRSFLEEKLSQQLGHIRAVEILHSIKHVSCCLKLSLIYLGSSKSTIHRTTETNNIYSRESCWCGTNPNLEIRKRVTEKFVCTMQGRNGPVTD